MLALCTTDRKMAKIAPSKAPAICVISASDMRATVSLINLLMLTVRYFTKLLCLFQPIVVIITIRYCY